MRADRLISLLMILQSRGPRTAKNLADELEVSERTIYRDVIALSAAGVPVYSERGPGGGIKLIESYRTNLTGLNPDEVRALFMLTIPAPIAELGIDKELRGALLKLSAALPATLQQAEGYVRQRILIDSEWWNPVEEPIPHLKRIHQAVWEDRLLQVENRYEYDVQIERVVEPYGLVSKGGVWYLVSRYEGNYGVHRLSSIWEVHILDDTFKHQADFDLATYWKEWCQSYIKNIPDFPVQVRVRPDLIPHLPRLFGSKIRDTFEEIQKRDEDGWSFLTLHFETLYEARSRILGFGGAIEVLEPLALKLSVADFAAQTQNLYQ
jgi:predicted DNA-binding transcriptional regulator YafY